MIPRTLFIHEFYQQHHHESSTPEQLCAEFIRAYPTLFAVSGELDHKFDVLGDDKLEMVSVDKRRFRERFLNLVRDTKGLTEKIFIYAVHFAYEYAFSGDDGSNKKIIVHHIHHCTKLLKVRERAPKTKVVATERDPRASACSYYKNSNSFLGTRDIKIFYKAVIRALDDISVLVDLKEEFDCAVVKLEDLHVKQERVLRPICDFLGVKFHPCMLESTFYGHKWWGDRVSGRDITGFNPNVGNENWRSNFWTRDLKIWAYFFRNRFANLGYGGGEIGYSKSFAYLALCLPSRMEWKYLSAKDGLKSSRSGVVRRLLTLIFEGVLFRARLIHRDEKINRNYKLLKLIS